MIRNEFEYQSIVAELGEQRRKIAEERGRLQSQGLTSEQIDEAVDHLNTRCQQLDDEVTTYERRTAPTWRIPID